jgi:polycomb protein EED
VWAQTLAGHGGPVNELCAHPRDAALLLSASKDDSVRLWNVHAQVCIAVFGGVDGHRDAVLSIVRVKGWARHVRMRLTPVRWAWEQDVHATGTRLLSAGMDHAVKEWDLDTPRLRERIALAAARAAAAVASREGAADGAAAADAGLVPQTAFPCLPVHFPLTTATTVHRNYIDCVRYYGDLILSKSTDSRIVLWRPAPPAPAPSAPSAAAPTPGTASDEAWEDVCELRMAKCDVWYVRFAVNVGRRLVACGNMEGTMYVWSADHLVRDQGARPSLPGASPWLTAMPLDGRVCSGAAGPGADRAPAAAPGTSTVHCHRASDRDQPRWPVRAPLPAFRLPVPGSHLAPQTHGHRGRRRRHMVVGS